MFSSVTRSVRFRAHSSEPQARTGWLFSYVYQVHTTVPLSVLGTNRIPTLLLHPRKVCCTEHRRYRLQYHCLVYFALFTVTTEVSCSYLRQLYCWAWVPYALNDMTNTSHTKVSRTRSRPCWYPLQELFFHVVKYITFLLSRQRRSCLVVWVTIT